MNLASGRQTALTLIASLTMAWASSAQAQDQPVNLKFSSWVPAQHALNPSLKAWGESLKAASGGTLNFTLFPAQQLGKAVDHYDMAKDGIADFSYVNPGYQPGRFPIFAAASLPFLASNGKGGSAAVDAWYRAYVAKEMKDVHFCFAFVHDPGALHVKKKIVSPDEIKGMKIRPATSVIGAMVTQLGGTNVQSSAPEAREILERGVADGITFPWGSILLFGIDKVTKFHMDVPLYVTPFVWVMNKDRYNKLAPKQKAAVDSHCTTEWAQKVAAPWADYEAAGRTKLAAAKGHTVYKLTTEQTNAWRKAVAPVVNSWAEDVKKRGENPDAVLKSLKDSLAKYQSAM
jgi:TRAP-type C4-dicarboxylate transport system substrate-binding protein